MSSTNVTRRPEWKSHDKVHNTSTITGKTIFKDTVQLPSSVVNFTGQLSATAGGPSNPIQHPFGSIGFMTLNINGTPFKIPVYPN